MAWKDGFIIEYKANDWKHTSCKDCEHADLKEKCCKKRPIVFSEDGYGNWKTCSDFQIDSKVDINKKKEAIAVREKHLYRNSSFTIDDDDDSISLFDLAKKNMKRKANAPKAYIKRKPGNKS